MKVKMFSVRPDEEKAIAAWRDCLDINTVGHDFTAADVAALDGATAIVLAQHGPLGDAAVYSQLAAAGVTHIALRITGFDIVDLAAAKANHITVTNVPAYSPRSVGELTLAHAMHLVRHLGETEARQAAGDYSWGGLEAQEIHTLTVGIIGAGKIGSAVARLFYALGATIIATDPSQRPELADILTYVDLSTLLSQADIVTVHTPLTADTTHLIDAAALKAMKPTAFLLNCARGPIVDTQALIQALQTKAIAGAAIDTIEGENGIFGVDLTGQPVENAALKQLQAMPNVEVSPHIGFYTSQAVQNMIDIALRDVTALAAGKASEHIVA